MRKTTIAAALLCPVTILLSSAFAQQVDPTKRNLTTREAAVSGDLPKPSEPEWADKIKNPVPWLKWGYDQRVRTEYVANPNLSEVGPDNYWNFQRYRSRLWASATPAPFLELNARMMWEARHWCDPQSKPDWVTADAYPDNLFFKLKPADCFTLSVGRQDINLGDGWLVFEGTPLDGSTTLYFDAARATIELKPAKTTIDAIWIYQCARIDAWLKPFCNDEKLQIEQDERGAIVWVANKSLKNTELDGYWIYKHDSAVAANGDQGEIYTFGGRAVHDFNDHWKMRSEGAYQFGRRNDAPLSAFGTTNRLNYSFNDKLKNQLRMNYEFLSGDDPDNRKDTAFDILWGRWPQWSELMVYTYIHETRVGEFTNLHRVGPGWQVEPLPKMQVNLDYFLLFAPENTDGAKPGFSEDGHFRGQLLTAWIRYKFNRFLSGHIVGEYFWPGNYYQSPGADESYFLRAELLFSF